ncbi:hypothetical protein HZA43_03480 [Candidatus Peregrinibacteria bacterium]|nr:hypothetical protein [Candidatus Peregrinibacteria bacterium]
MSLFISLKKGVPLFTLFVLFVILLSPGRLLADRTPRDIMKDELARISQTIDRTDLDDTIKIENDKTQKQIIGELLDIAENKVNDDPTKTSDDDARSAIQAVQQALVNPHLFKNAINDKKEVTQVALDVLKGDIFEDLVPQLIKLAFKVAWVVIFISFLVSGILMILSMDSEDRLVKAKAILYYSLIGFTMITLAFAIVKALTNINFFS